MLNARRGALIVIGHQSRPHAPWPQQDRHGGHNRRLLTQRRIQSVTWMFGQCCRVFLNELRMTL